MIVQGECEGDFGSRRNGSCIGEKAAALVYAVAKIKAQLMLDLML